MSDLCDKCKNEDDISLCSRCEDGSEYIKRTNADRIRSMSDEELAEFLVNFENKFGIEYEGEQSCLDWLQSEVEE